MGYAVKLQSRRDKNILALYDVMQGGTSHVQQYYNPDIFDVVSGTIQHSYGSETTVTFSIKITGKLKTNGWASIYPANFTYTINGINALGQTMSVKSGDILIYKAGLYYPILVATVNPT